MDLLLLPSASMGVEEKVELVVGASHNGDGVVMLPLPSNGYE
jgi:hypothetical protein